MKKLCVILAMCLVAVTAHAEYYMTIDGIVTMSAEVEVGSTATIGIWSTDTTLPPEPTGNTQWGLYHSLNVVAWNGDYTNGNGSLTDLVYQPAAGANAYGWTNGPPYAYIANTGWSVVNPTDVEAGLWFELTYNALLEGDVVLGLTNGDYAGYQYLNITNVPEPATISLLGLAGIFVLRRRRA